jgi:hypothetical protein
MSTVNEILMKLFTKNGFDIEDEIGGIRNVYLRKHIITIVPEKHACNNFVINLIDETFVM